MAAPRKKRTTPTPEAEDDNRLHPRRTEQLIGHKRAAAAMEQAWASGRMAHGWLLTGPEGIGKSSFAYQMARRILMAGPGDASLPPLPEADHPISRRVREASHADLHVLEPDEGASDIKVEKLRDMAGFIHLKPGEGHWRVIIIDPAEAMNLNAANALLKMLEEPPPQTILLLISHRPGKLLDTIRSRCRALALPPLTGEECAQLLERLLPDAPAEDRAALALLAEGSPGLAQEFYRQDGLARYRQLLAGLKDGTPRLALADALASREAAPWAMSQRLLRRLLHLRVRALSATPVPRAECLPEEAPFLASCQPDAQKLAENLALWDKAQHLFAEDAILHLDRRALVLEILRHV